MTPSSSSKLLKRRSKHQSHRGDVESSTSPSPYASETEREPEWVLPPTPVKGHPTPSETTPKRRVIATVEGSATKIAGKKRDNLQARLQSSVAKVKKSKSTTEGLETMGSPAPSTSTILTYTTAKTSVGPIASHASASSDKVVVCVRMKPTTSPFASLAYELTPTSLSLSSLHPNVQKRGGKSGREAEYTYTFDKLLEYPAKTPALYEAKVAPLVGKAMNGFNSTIFAYGQTGSGKSFTMTGTDSELGIIPCAVDGVFDAINADPERAFLLRVSYIEIYNETLRDLLNFKKGALRDDEKPAIHTAKGKVYVDPLVEEIVSCPQDVVDLLERGNAGRKIGATDWNDRSSRSHCVFTIIIESRPRDEDEGGDGDIRLSRLNLIDLAGSEKAVSDVDRRGEGKHINQSLLALREVVHKLTEKGKQSHVPYRNSKLTHLLENALGGDSNICVICTLSAEEEHCSETLETLKFAGRCSQVETKAQKNILPSSERAVIRAKDEEIEELKRQLQGLASKQNPRHAESESESSGQISGLVDSVAAMEARKHKLTAQLAKLNGEILTSELPRSMSGRLPMSPPKPKRRRISEFMGGLGVGTPRSMAISERRAVSGMVRVTEDVEMPSMMGALVATSEREVTMSFDGDRTIAALRRKLTSKAEELANRTNELATALKEITELSAKQSELMSVKADFQSLQMTHRAILESLKRNDEDSRDLHGQLVTTRQELVDTISEKAEKIDVLEKEILDLRKEREDLMVDATGKEGELLSAKAGWDHEMLETRRLGDELEGSRKENSSQADEIQQMSRNLQALDRQCQEAAAAVQSANVKYRELETSHSQLEIDLRQRQALESAREEELASIKKEKEALFHERSTAVEDLDRFQKAAMSSESTLVSELKEELRKAREMVTKQEGEKEELRKRLNEGEARFVVLQAEVTKEKNGRTGLEEEMIGLREELEKEKEGRKGLELEMEKLSGEGTQVKDREGRMMEELKGLQERLRLGEEERARMAEESDKSKGMEAGLSASRETVANLERERSTLLADLEGERQRSATIAQELSSLGEKVKFVESEREKIKAELDESRSNVSRFQSAVKSAEASASEEFSRLTRAIEQKKEKEAQLVAELETLADQLDAKNVLCQKLERRTETLEAADRDFAASKEDLTMTQRELVTFKVEAEELKGELESAKERIAALAQELLDVKATVTVTTTSTQTRHASSPAATLGHLKGVWSGDSEEIERLEKVVEAQKIMIEDQREKIKFWARELEQQREVVRMLTAEGGSSHTQTTNTPPRGHTKGSHSLSTIQNIPLGNGGSLKPLSATFTARNLALPTCPSPLPLHPSQFSNAARKTRRVTIEHDMDRLTETSKVNKAKAMFDTPNSSPVKPASSYNPPSRQNSTVTAKQRRP
ncbi:hypothetical protein P7C73_g6472, partial [Tremellales sp. Uapishka_1]